MSEHVPIYENVTHEEFVTKIQPVRFPAILRGLDIGPCRQKWNPEYLIEKIGSREAKIHVSATTRMDFLAKNFLYKTLPFASLIRRAAEDIHQEYFISNDEVYYLRALGNDPRGREVANFVTHFPELKDDFQLPPLILEEDVFSSVFRVSSKGVQLWTHYDVMDNLLVQVRGRKRVVLFSPTDTLNLYLSGDKSRVIDIDDPDLERFPDFQKAKKIECFLEEGDILFLPALWFHNVTALDFSIAVNIFWKNLDHELYDKKDPYGNKDLLPGAKALQMVDSALKQLTVLPPEYRDFYAKRMLAKIQTSLE